MAKGNTIQLPGRWDKHHSFWTEKSYQGGFEQRQFRNHYGLVIPGPRMNHEMVHKNLQPPIKPERWQMGEIIELLDSQHPTKQMDRLWGLHATRAYFESSAEFDHRPHIADAANETAYHMARQIGFLSLKLANQAAA